MGVARVARFIPPSRLPLVLLLTAVAFSGCVVGDFLGAYFNTYYNAQTLFSQAEEEIWSQNDTKLSGHNLLLDLNIPASSKTKLTTVVEKCSKLLQDHPDSKFVDDALLMIGKAFFYQGDFTRAERKFKELLTTYPTSSLGTETRVWMAYAEFKENNLDNAEATAKQLLEDAKKDGDHENEAYAALLLGRIRASRLDYVGSSDYYQIAGAEGGNADLRTSAYLLAGDMYIAGADSERAYTMYIKAENESRNYLNTYLAQLGEATTLSRLGRGTSAIGLLTSMRGNTNYKEFWGQVDVETGNAYRRMGNYAEAIQQYHYVDTAYARSDWATAADYHLGRLWEEVYGDFDSARVAYTRGRAGNAQSTIATRLAARYDLMTRYATYRRAIQLNDSLLQAGVAAPEKQDSAAVNARVDSVRERQVESDRRVPDTSRAGTKPIFAPVSPDTLNARLAFAINELASLFYAGLSLPDSAVAWFDTLLTRYPGSPNTPRAWYVIAQVTSARDSIGGAGVADSLYRCIIRDYPQSMFASAARKILGLPTVAAVVDSAELGYHQGEELLLKGDYQIAIDTLRAVSRGYPRSPYASRAQFAVGWLYEEKLQQGDSALAAYRRLIKEYPSSPYAAIVRPKVDAADQEIRNAEQKAADEAKQKAAEEAKQKAAGEAKAGPGEGTQAKGVAPGKPGEPSNFPPPPTSVKPAGEPADSSEVPRFVRGRLGRAVEVPDTVKPISPKPPGADTVNVHQGPQ